MEFWWQLDDETGELAHNFTDPTWDTRFLGDLYQDVSEDVREKYALLQTPEFVESFILDRTLGPAIDEFGLAETDLIDPACGSGHFLLGAFDRLFTHWKQEEPTANPIGLAERVLMQVAGVDLNPYAVAIARFRLLVAALRACDVTKLADAPDFGVRVAVGDSLLHGTLPGQQDLGIDAELETSAHLYATEDPTLVHELLSKTYKAVVANPPYITAKDPGAREQYRNRYSSCFRKFSLGAPFSERLFTLALRGEGDEVAGFVGQITANSFMKREFGKRIVENFFPDWDVTTLIDTSGAHLPGHNTPTVIVLARNRKPSSKQLRAVMGLRGEPSTPEVAAEGLVWSAIEAQVDQPDSTSEFVRVVDWPRERIHQHPVVFGGAADLWFRIDAAASNRLGDYATAMGFTAISGEDGAFLAEARKSGSDNYLPLIEGHVVRDWAASVASLSLIHISEPTRPY